MKDLDLFQAALGLNEQWIVTKSEFKPQEKRLDIFLDFIPGSEFACPECKVNAKVHDTIEKTWQHLNFFQHAAYLHARVPRIECQKDGVKLIDVPWARKQSGFTLLFEALIMAMTREMPVNAIAALVGITDKRIWRVIEHYVKKDLATQDLSEVTRIGVDETSSKRGHSYVTIFVDMDTNKAIFVTEGKDASTVKSFKDHLLSHKGNPVKIKEVFK
jgi:transposase